ncbi:GNAT family N-acetyltransferase [Kitasatospora sp. RG8]|uniref:GNAT family N-acetyltransferase n=1 Tax=Kitasatospora sp. RG8 TaxID=2820815 RepID=UPI001ADF0389|nr:GNAT family N-acetyltransferase [Kitasatospora sp. RG8]MBP0453805.1 GNAT family N-acetyltransferase [Kitasatospora sp. RG8]
MTLTNEHRSGEPWLVRTDRLELRAVCADDLAELFRINTDPRTWSHVPEGRHRDEETTRAWIGRAVKSWESFGLGYWTARLPADGTVVGVGGVAFQPASGFWNLYYRLDPAHWGRGYATELSRAAAGAARRHSPEVPVAAWIHTHNAGSRRVAARLGLADRGLRRDPTLGELLHLYTDRQVPPSGA